MTNSSYSIANAFNLSPFDLTLLAQGRTIAVFPWVFMMPSQTFALTTTEHSSAVKHPNYWAKCESCKSIDTAADLQLLRQIVPGSEEIIDRHFESRKFVFIAVLRVYYLPVEIEVLPERVGDFSLLKQPMLVNTLESVISDCIFAKRQQQLNNLSPSPYPQLEALQQQLVGVASPLENRSSTPDLHIDSFARDLRIFLEWEQPSQKHKSFTDLNWIDRISDVGNSSDGTEFEKLVRRSLLQLGFTNSLNNSKASLNPDTTGGAGGIDIYCDRPFSLVGECKASKYERASNTVSSQLIHLGITHLGKETFDRSVKIIFAAGSLTSHAQQAAIQTQMNVMTPSTLQRLVTLKANYPGSIDLRELEQCLKQEPFGADSDLKVNKYIDSIDLRIQNFAHIVSTLKNYLESQALQEIGIDKFHVAFGLFHPLLKYSEEELYQMMIELSSPLSGYLGRIKGHEWKSDRFYFLRDLTI
jgi:Restriction endonuclease